MADTFGSDAANDTIIGSGDADTIYGGNSGGTGGGNDVINGNSGVDTLFGGAGNDNLSGATDDDKAYGGSGADVLLGFGGNDTLYGGSGADYFFGGGGNDTFYGGDPTYETARDGSVDALSYDGIAGLTAGIFVDMLAGTVSGDASIGTDRVFNIERIEATHFNDTIQTTGYSSNAAHSGDQGNYLYFEGGGGDDTILGNINNDNEISFAHATGGVIVDFKGMIRAGYAYGGSSGVGVDTFQGTSRVTGGGFNDTFHGFSTIGTNQAYDGGLGGDDTFYGGAAGIDEVEYDGGEYTSGIIVNLAAGTVTRSGGPSNVGNDMIRSIESVRGTTHADTFDATGFSGSSTNAGSFGLFNTFQGFGGADVVTGNGSTRLSYANASGSVVVNFSATGQGSATATYGSDVATDTFSGVAIVTTGNGGDTIFGSFGNDVADGVGGNDTLYGSLGDDTLYGGSGDDRLYGGLSADTLYGGTGFDDRVFFTGVAGVTVTMLGSGFATVTGDGNDTLFQVELIVGTSLADTFFGSSSSDQFMPGLGNDTYFGEGSNDLVWYQDIGGPMLIDLAAGTATGAAGNDVLVDVEWVLATNFADTIIGNAADNYFRADDAGTGAADTVYGGAGNDVLSYVNEASAVTINMTTGSVVNGLGIIDLVAQVEVIEGSVFNDTIYGTTGSDPVLSGGFGDDTIYALNGSDTILGHAGNDTVYGAGTYNPDRFAALDFDTLDYSVANTTEGIIVNLESGTVWGGASLGLDRVFEVEAVIGTAGADTLIGGSGARFEAFRGGNGNDTIIGGGADTRADYTGAIGPVSIILSGAGTGEGTVSGALVAIDTVYYVNHFWGGGTSDIYDASAFRVAGASFTTFNEFRGGAGDDTIFGNGDTRLSYDSSNFGIHFQMALGTVNDGLADTDTFTGVNAVVGTAFVDTLRGAEGDDTFTGGAGNDSIYGGYGFDMARYDAADPALTTGIQVDMAAGTVIGDAVVLGTDRIVDIEAIDGSLRNDTYNAVGFNTGTGSFIVGGFAIGAYNMFRGGAGNDTITGNGWTEVSAGAAWTSVHGFFTADGVGTIVGGAGDVDVFTGAFHLTGSRFNDTLEGSGSTTAGYFEMFSGGAGNDTIDGNGGFDFVSYARESAAVVVNLATGIGTGDSSVGRDLIFEVEGVIGGRGDDTLTGSGTGGETLIGGMGADTFFGGGGANVVSYRWDPGSIAADLGGGAIRDGFGTFDAVSGITIVEGSISSDTLFGSAADDTLYGADGGDLLSGRLGDDTLYGGDDPGTMDFVSYAHVLSAVTVNLSSGLATGEGTDRLFGIDGVEGGAGNDVLIGDAQSNSLFGNGGDDTLDGGVGPDTVFGGTGNDLYKLDHAQDFADENNGDGTDRAIVSVSGATLGGGIERIDLMVTGTITGGWSDNTINGTAGGDRLNGADGNDRLNGLDGNDVLDGGADNDTFYGGTGNDTYYGGTGNDFFRIDDAGDRADETGGGGQDRMQLFVAGYTVGAGIEVIDFVAAAGGAVTAAGTTDNTITGTTLIDTIFGGAGNDTFFGGAGNDSFYGGTGNDTFYGGGGDDFFRIEDVGDAFFETGAGIDRAQVFVSGVTIGEGVERIDVAGSLGVTVTAAGATNNTMDGSPGGDRFLAGAGNDRVIGRAGNDTLEAGDGDDTIDAGDGNDTLYGGAGNDRMFGGIGTNTFFGGAGNDDYRIDSATDVTDETGGAGFDRAAVFVSGVTVGNGIELIEVIATGGATVWAAGTTNNTMVGNTGLDVLYGGDGLDTFWGGAGSDTYYGGAGDDLYQFVDAGDRADETGGAGFDRVELFAASATVGEGVERIDARISTSLTVTALGATDNTITVRDGADQLFAGAGNDRVFGGAGADTMRGEAGNDFLDAGTENDTLYGGDGNDRLFGGGGTDTMFGGVGDDQYSVDSLTDIIDETGGSGADRVDVLVSGYTVGVGFERIDFLAIGGGTITAGGAFTNTIFGSDSLDVIFAGGGVDTIFGGAGADTIIGGLLTDSITGGTGADIFRYTLGDGNDRFLDFNRAEGDKVDLTSVTFVNAIGSIANLSDGSTLAAQLAHNWIASDFI